MRKSYGVDSRITDLQQNRIKVDTYWNQSCNRFVSSSLQFCMYFFCLSLVEYAELYFFFLVCSSSPKERYFNLRSKYRRLDQLMIK